MTKADLIEVIHDKVGLSKESADIVELVFETMKQTLESSEKSKSVALETLRFGTKICVSGGTLKQGSPSRFRRDAC